MHVARVTKPENFVGLLRGSNTRPTSGRNVYEYSTLQSVANCDSFKQHPLAATNIRNLLVDVQDGTARTGPTCRNSLALYHEGNQREAYHNNMAKQQYSSSTLFQPAPESQAKRASDRANAKSTTQPYHTHRCSTTCESTTVSRSKRRGHWMERGKLSGWRHTCICTRGVGMVSANVAVRPTARTTATKPVVDVADTAAAVNLRGIYPVI